MKQNVVNWSISSTFASLPMLVEASSKRFVAGHVWLLFFQWLILRALRIAIGALWTLRTREALVLLIFRARGRDAGRRATVLFARRRGARAVGAGADICERARLLEAPARLGRDWLRLRLDRERDNDFEAEADRCFVRRPTVDRREDAARLPAILNKAVVDLTFPARCHEDSRKLGSFPESCFFNSNFYRLIFGKHQTNSDTCAEESTSFKCRTTMAGKRAWPTLLCKQKTQV